MKYIKTEWLFAILALCSIIGAFLTFSDKIVSSAFYIGFCVMLNGCGIIYEIKNTQPADRTVGKK